MNPDQSYESAELERHLLELVIETAPYYQCILDANDQVLAWSKVMAIPIEKVLGKKITRGSSFYDYLLPSQHERIRQALAQCRVTQQSVSYIQSVDYPDMTRVMEVSYHPIVVQNQYKGTSCIAKDVTQQQATERELQKSEQRFRTMFEKSPLGIGLIDSYTGEILDSNPRYAEIAGRTIEELCALDWQTITHPDDIQPDLDNMAAMNAGKTNGFQMPKRYILPDGTPRWVEISVAPLEKPANANPRHLCMVKDLSEHAAIEEILQRITLAVSRLTGADFLKQISQQLSSFLEADHTLIALLNKENPDQLDTISACVDGQIIDNFSYSIKGTPCEQTIFTSLCVYESNVAMTFPADTMLHGLEGYIGVPLFNSKGDRIGVIATVFKKPIQKSALKETIIRLFSSRIVSEIERLQAEQDLIASKNHLRMILDAEPECIKLLNEDNELLEMNPAGLAMLEVDDFEAVRGVNASRVVLPPYRAAFEQLTRDVFEGKSGKLEFEIRGMKGGHRWVETHSVPMRDAAGTIVSLLAVTRDITERKRAEEERAEAALKYQLVFESSNDAIMVLSSKGFVDCNTQTLRMLGYDSKAEFAALGHPARFSPPVQADGTDSFVLSDQYIQQALQRGTCRFEWLHQRKNGEVFPAEVQLSAFLFKDTWLVQGTVRDITERKRAESQLRKSESLLKYTQQIARLGSWEFYFKNDELHWSDELYRIHELDGTPKEQLYASYRQRFHPDDLPKLDECIEQTLRTGKGYTIEHRIVCPNGGIKHIFGMGEPIHDTDGRIIGLRGMGQDVSYHKRVEEMLRKRENELRTILNALPVGVLLFDRKGSIVNANPAAERLWGILSCKPMQSTNFALVHEHIKGWWGDTGQEVKPEEWAAARALTKGEVVLGEVVNVQRADANISTMILSAIPLFDDENKIIGAVAVQQDITEMKQAQQASMEKDRFLTNMSHEIRTPMNAIIGFTDLLEQTELSAVQQNYLRSVKLAGENLLSIINDILDFAKIESGKLTLEQQPFSLQQTIEGVFSLLKVKAEEKSLHYDLLYPPLPPLVLGDSLRLAQILINLVGNAVKFTEKGGVTMAITMLEEDDQHCRLRFCVRDTGIGIPEHKLDSIFERFTQASDEVSRRFGGTGLGLSIAKNLVEIQGGTIDLQSKVGEGSAFCFELSYPKVQQPVVSLAGLSSQTLRSVHQARILLCEDNVLNQRLAENVLTRFGFQVEIAENGRIGLDKIRQNAYDLILMDLQMPEMDGYATTQAIRYELRLPVPIIAMTAHLLPKEKERCLQIGMDDYIPKPFKQSELFEKICLHLLPEKPALQLDYLHSLSGEDPDFERDLWTLFLRETPANMELIAQAFETKDAELLRKTTHKIKSSLALLGIPIVVELALSLEKQAAQGQLTPAMQTDYRKLQRLLDGCYEQVHALIV